MRINSYKSKTVMILLLFLTSILFVFENTTNSQSITTRDVKTYALLVDQFAPNSNNPGQYMCNAIEFRNSLMTIGWDESSFYYLFGDTEITATNLQEKIEMLRQTVDENDVVIFFFAAHGYGCLKDILDFNYWFHDYFLEIQTNYKYLLIDACHASEFIEPLAAYESTESFYAMGSVASTEYAIGFIQDEEEWLYSEPEFTGVISAHFWSQTLTNSSADVNSDSYIDMGEMYDYSLPIIKKIYSEIFIVDPDLAEWIENETGYIDNYPRPVVINSLSEDISLYRNYLTDNIAKINVLTQPQKFGIIFGSIGAAVVIGVVVIFLIVKKRRKIPVQV
ncbi:MAG: caspase family protein [Candidatus Heimdallarchaeota archaeon]